MNPFFFFFAVDEESKKVKCKETKERWERERFKIPEYYYGSFLVIELLIKFHVCPLYMDHPRCGSHLPILNSYLCLIKNVLFFHMTRTTSANAFKKKDIKRTLVINISHNYLWETQQWQKHYYYLVRVKLEITYLFY